MTVEHLLMLLLPLALAAVLLVLIFGSICGKAGFSKWLGLLILVPLLNFVFIWVFAYIKWPAIDKAA